MLLELPPFLWNQLSHKSSRTKKAYCDLAIVDISDNWSPVEGGKKILLFSKKICRTDIEVHISYTISDNMETKTFKAPFKPSDVHEQCGISFRTPPFPDQFLNKQILVSTQFLKLILNKIP